MQKIHLTRTDAGWIVNHHTSMDTELAIGGEALLNKLALDLDLPLFAAGSRFQPLCKEIPRDDGIDLLYLGEEGHLLAAEFKTLKGQIKRGDLDARYHARREQELTPAAMAAYVAKRPLHAVQGAPAKLQAWIKTWKVNPDWTLSDFLEHGKLQLGVVVTGDVSAVRVPHNLPMTYCGIILSSDKTQAVLTLSAPDRVDTDPARFQKELDDAYARRSQMTAGNAGRVHVAAQAATAYFDGLAPTSATRQCLAELRDGMLLASGTGKMASQTLRLQLENVAGKRTTICILQGADEIQVWGDGLRTNKDYLAVSEADINSLMRDLRQTLPGSAVDLKEDSEWLRMHFDRLNHAEKTKTVRKVIQRLRDFIELSKRNIASAG